MVQVRILLLFKDSETEKIIDHMTFYDKFSLNDLNSEYTRIMTVLCQPNRRNETSAVQKVKKL